MLAGILFFAFTAWFWLPELQFVAPMLLPMTADGVIQLKTAYESNNQRRAWTGFLFGYGLLATQTQCMIRSFWFGYHLTH